MIILVYLWFAVVKSTVGQSLASTYLYPEDILGYLAWILLGTLGYSWILLGTLGYPVWVSMQLVSIMQTAAVK